MRWGWWQKGLLALLSLALLGTALALVLVRHDSRVLFMALQTLEQERDDLDREWQQLLLEQSVWAQPARIEQVAREQLQMRIPSPADIQVIRPVRAPP